MEPKFHEDASNLDELVPFEECVKLLSTGESVVRAPEYLLLTHNGREFKLVYSSNSITYWFEFVSCIDHCMLFILYLFLSIELEWGTGLLGGQKGK